jgi:gamma-glutamyl hydrolase
MQILFPPQQTRDLTGTVISGARMLFGSFSISLCILTLLFGRVHTKSSENDWPIIGVFTQPSSDGVAECGGDCLYLAASYVKFLESAGARVVPVNYYADNTEIDQLFESLNGFLFVGGGSPYPKSAQRVFDRTVDANAKGDFSPLYGVCMGFQWLLLAATNGQLALDPSDGTQMDAENISLPLDFTASAQESRLMQNAPENIYKIFAERNVTMNNHHYGIFTEHFDNTPELSNFYAKISTNKDRQGTEFVSTIEGVKYPMIFGSQWHPEKTIFEWQEVDGVPREAINHSPDSIVANRYMADYFVQLTRHSNHKFANPAVEQASLIYNYAPVKTSGSFVQKYYFEKDFKSYNA